MPLGIIQLSNKPLLFPGSVGNCESYPFDVLYETPADIYTEQIIEGANHIGRSYSDKAKKLVERGADAIMSTCGFAILFQKQVKESVNIPVGMSSLLLLPYLLKIVPDAQKIGVLTFDANKLTVNYLDCVIPRRDQNRLLIAGIEGTHSWCELIKPQQDLQYNDFRQDVLQLTERIAHQHRDLGAILLECSGFCSFRNEIAKLTKSPTLDFLNLADLLMSGQNRLS